MIWNKFRAGPAGTQMRCPAPANAVWRRLAGGTGGGAVPAAATAWTMKHPDPDSLVLEFEDDFDGTQLDAAKWVPTYLAHWSSREASRARYTIGDGALTLRVDPDQTPWCPDFDGGVRVSSLQTGQFSGPAGSGIGQHRFKPGLAVREAQPEQRLYTPTYGYIELRARAELGPNHLAALWMIGFEDRPDDSGEITVMEIFGRNVGPEGTRLGHGIKRVNDPRLEQEFFEPLLPFDPADWHVYGADWRAEGVDFYLDGQRLGHVAQAPHYPMQLMLNVYDLPDLAGGDSDEPPTFTVDYVRGYRHKE